MGVIVIVVNISSIIISKRETMLIIIFSKGWQKYLVFSVSRGWLMRMGENIEDERKRMGAKIFFKKFCLE